jgi:large subunit ribosomal protein L9
VATTELLLLKSIEKLGREGERIKVRAGYARNYLLPQKIAIPVTRANQKQIDSLLQKREERLARELAEAETIAEKLLKVSCIIPVKAGSDGKLFGSVTANELEKILRENGISLERKQILLKHPAKKLGSYSIKIKLNPQKEVDFSFEVVAEGNDIENTAS